VWVVPYVGEEGSSPFKNDRNGNENRIECCFYNTKIIELLYCCYAAFRTIYYRISEEIYEI
jgi:hypothetical protein